MRLVEPACLRTHKSRSVTAWASGTWPSSLLCCAGERAGGGASSPLAGIAPVAVHGHNKYPRSQFGYVLLYLGGFIGVLPLLVV